MQQYVYHHTLDPFAIELQEQLGVRWYGLAYLVGFVVAYLLIRLAAARQRTPLSASAVGDFVFTAALGAVIGGRLGYCVFYQPELLWEFTSSIPFWGVLAVHNGGMASHGGIIGVILACGWFSYRRGYSWMHLVDLAAWTSPVGLFFGRLANFVNGELPGRIASEGFPFVVRFPQDIFMWAQTSPDRLRTLGPVVESLPQLPHLTIAQWERWIDTPRASWYLIQDTLERIVYSIQQGNEQLASLLFPLLDNRYPSQLIQAGLEGVLLFVLVGAVFFRSARTGVPTAAFVVAYGVLRIVGERYRLPDLHIGYQALGLTRGQWLSLVMVIGGSVLYLLLKWRCGKIGDGSNGKLLG